MRPINWASLNSAEREAMVALAALHREFGPDALFTSDAVGFVVGHTVVAELGFLRVYGLVDFATDDEAVWGYRLNGEGFNALPDSEERRALEDHRAQADQELREEM